MEEMKTMKMAIERIRLLEEEAFMILIFQKQWAKIIMFGGDEGKKESMQAIYSANIYVISCLLLLLRNIYIFTLW